MWVVVTFSIVSDVISKSYVCLSSASADHQSQEARESRGSTGQRGPRVKRVKGVKRVKTQDSRLMSPYDL